MIIIFQAAHCDDPVILLEVGLCIKWLIEKYGEELKDPLWDRTYKILEIIIVKCGQLKAFAIRVESRP